MLTGGRWLGVGQAGEQERSLRPQKGMGAIVEDKIQLSMMQGRIQCLEGTAFLVVLTVLCGGGAGAGDFDHLQGRGKPLERVRHSAAS